MRYPNVLFFRYEKYQSIDTFLKEHDEQLDCTLQITSNAKDLNRLYSPNYHILVTFGESDQEYLQDFYQELTSKFTDRWLHYHTIDNIETFVYGINYCYIENVVTKHMTNRPLFSIFTTSYQSYHKIIRCYHSILSQTWKDWEWIILDDSPDDQHFHYLRQQFQHEHRIRLFRKSKNSGSIGDVKNEAVSLCRGKYVLEMDHDDEILPDCLQDAIHVFEEDSEVGFLYMDFINIYENGENFFYQSEIISLGYTSYYLQKIRHQWRYVYITANINNISMSHLVACPNHPRIWRREILLQLGNYSEFLPICDDYEILLRTMIHTKCVKIPKVAYIQYMNENNNNFSFIRNREINRIGPEFISPIFFEHFQVQEKMKLLQAYESNEQYRNVPLWKRDPNTYTPQYCNTMIHPDYQKQFCILGVDALYTNLSYLQTLYDDRKTKKYDFILLDYRYTHDYIIHIIETLQWEEMKCYTMIHATNEELVNYFQTMYRSTKEYEIVRRNGYPMINHECHMIEEARSLLEYHSEFPTRLSVLQHFTTPLHKYLEIGVEYGTTFCPSHFKEKIGVDPDPKLQDTSSDHIIMALTSDEFFATNTQTFDVIFIDGMHQVEYVIRDLNHAIQSFSPKNTTTKCQLFLDDILPMSEREQYKIPIKNVYEHGILKYGEPWTGDVWKVMYYILLYGTHAFGNIQYYQHVQYRGIARLEILDRSFQIPMEKMEMINAFSYQDDFISYLTLLDQISKAKSPDLTSIPETKHHVEIIV